MNRKFPAKSHSLMSSHLPSPPAPLPSTGEGSQPPSPPAPLPGHHVGHHVPMVVVAGRGAGGGLMKASNCLHRFCCALPSRSDDAMVAVGFNPRTVNTPKGIASGHRAQHGRRRLRFQPSLRDESKSGGIVARGLKPRLPSWRRYATNLRLFNASGGRLPRLKTHPAGGIASGKTGFPLPLPHF